MRSTPRPARVCARRHSRSPALTSLLAVLIALALTTPAGAGVVAWGPNALGELGAGYSSGHEPPVPALANLPGVTQVVSSYHSSYALLSDGTVRSWGGNVWGQLGDGNRQQSDTPQLVSGLSNVTALAAAGAHAMALLSNGTVETWGSNIYGQLGNGTSGHGHEVGQWTPVPVPGLKEVVAIAAGGADDFAILRDGTLLGWGENRRGQLGDGTTEEKDVPTPVKGVSGAKAVAVGGMASIGGHTLALLDNGTVLAWGGDYAGQLGDGNTTQSTVPQPVRGLAGVSALSASISHSLALLADGTVMAWGSNTYGELGAPTRETCHGEPCSTVPVAAMHGASAIRAAFRFSEAIDAGHVYSWGINKYHQLGNGTDAEAPVPTLVPGLSEVTSISADEFHTLALSNGLPPEQIAEAAAGSGSLTLRWRAPERPAGTSTYWTVKWRPVLRPKPTTWLGWKAVPSPSRSFTVTGLVPNQPYEMTLYGKGSWNLTIQATPLR